MISAASEAQLLEIHRRGDYLSVEKFLEFSQQTDIHYQKADALLVGMTWRGAEHKSLLRSNVRGMNLLIGHSHRAMSASQLLALRALKGFRRALVTNLTTEGFLSRLAGLRRLPIGLCPSTQESVLHEVYGDQTQLMRAWKSTAPPQRPAELTTIYSNFSVWTAPHHRAELDQFVQSLPHVTRQEPSADRKSRFEYLCRIRQSGIALCPEGRGQDTHRLYEILYMGALPIVLRGNYQWQLCRSFGWPVVGLESWNELADLNRVRQLAEGEDFTESGLRSLSFSNWTKSERFFFPENLI